MKYLRFGITVVALLIAVYYVERTPNTEQLSSAPTNSVSQIENYEQARGIFWRDLYPSGSTLYCGQRFNGQKRNGLNIEHVFPMSWVTNSLECDTRSQCRASSALFNKIEADMHNLYPSLTEVNQARSSYAFAEIGGEAREFGRDCDFEVSQRQRLAEPRPEVRGDVARAMFYMAGHYKKHGLKLFRRQAQLLLDWHKSDPPDASEKARNNTIERIQGWRNPYIDNPDNLDNLVAQGYFF